MNKPRLEALASNVFLANRLAAVGSASQGSASLYAASCLSTVAQVVATLIVYIPSVNMHTNYNTAQDVGQEISCTRLTSIVHCAAEV